MNAIYALTMMVMLFLLLPSAVATLNQQTKESAGFYFQVAEAF